MSRQRAAVFCFPLRLASGFGIIKQKRKRTAPFQPAPCEKSGKACAGRRKGYPNGYVYECRMAAGKTFPRSAGRTIAGRKTGTGSGDFPAGGIRLSVGEHPRLRSERDRPCEHAGNALHGNARGGCRMAAHRAAHRDVKQPAPHPGYLSHGRALRPVPPGFHKLSLRHGARRRVGPGTGGRDWPRCEPSGSGVRHHTGAGSRARCRA